LVFGNRVKDDAKESRILKSDFLTLFLTSVLLKDCGEIQEIKGHLVDALALRGDEGRDRLRKAAGSCQ
jgi:hypothetical protein